jgi:hypothetical protein
MPIGVLRIGQSVGMEEHPTDERNGWQYASRLYEQRSGDPEWLMKEALRRAVDIRDLGEGTDRGGRSVVLVAVLNALSNALGYDTYSGLWSDWDL